MFTNQQTKPLTNTKSQIPNREAQTHQGTKCRLEQNATFQKIQIMQNKPNYTQPRTKNHDSKKNKPNSNPIFCNFCNFLLFYALLRAFFTQENLTHLNNPRHEKYG